MKMPGDVLPVMLSTGVGVGVLAGVVSGVCFLVYNGLAWSRRVRESEKIRAKGEEKICSSCFNNSVGECSSCSLPICDECSAENQEDIRRCQPCSNDRLIFARELYSGNSFLKLLKETVSFGYWSDSEDNLNRSKVNRAVVGANDSVVEKKTEEQNRQVRDFLQKLAENLAGGSLDDVSIGEMYQHPEYHRMFRRFHGPLCSAIARLSICLRNSSTHLPLTNGPAAGSAHIKLQQLIQRVIEEALKLPALLDYSGIDRDIDGRLPEFNPKTYEDLLATAILNKVIDRYQNESKRNNGASSSGVHSGSSSPGDFGRGKRRRNVRKGSSPEPSSLEPMSHDDYAHSDSSGHATDVMDGKMKLTYNEYSTDEEDPYKMSYDNPVDGALSNIDFDHKDRVAFPEYGGDIIEIDEEDDYVAENRVPANGNISANGEIYTNNSSWEENWLFQKKKLKSQSVPVPMLIPNSNTEYRALIGDRDADDTTDLSDAGSDTDEISSDIKHVLLNSKTIIGGKNSEIILSLVNDNNNLIDGELNECDASTKTVNCVYKDENDNTTVISNFDNEKQIKNSNFEKSSKINDSEDIVCDTVKKEHNKILAAFLSNFESCNEEILCEDTQELLPSLSAIKNDSLLKSDVIEATNLDVIDSKDSVDHESLENQQQESEYTETVTIPVQRHMDSLKRQHNITEVCKANRNEDKVKKEILYSTPILKVNKDENKEFQTDTETSYCDILQNVDDNDQKIKLSEIESDVSDNHDKQRDDQNNQETTDDSAECHIPGSIAEREHKKWLNAVPMINNPYSPEAIQSRLNKQKQSLLFDIIQKPTADTPCETKPKSPTLQKVLSKDITEHVRYGRDYYINAAKNSSGARKKSTDSNLHKLNDENYLVKHDVLNETEKTLDINSLHESADIYSATPIIIDDIDEQFDEIYRKATKFENDDVDIYVLPVNMNDKNVEKLVQMTNGVLLHDDESLDQGDSIGSLDETTRIYNINTGQIINQLQENLFNKSYDSDNQCEKNISNTKSWKSSGDVYGDANENNVIKYNNNLKADVADHPSVKILAKKFLEQTKEDREITKPKRRISRDLLENEIINKTMTNCQTAIKQPQHKHSLTARSISKEFREELKLSMPAVTNAHPGGSKYIPNGLEDPIRENMSTDLSKNQLPKGSIKNKLEFFENLACK